MKTNLKLSLVAAALATVGFSANAANVAVTAVDVSKQGVATVSDAAFDAGTPNVVFTPKAAYSVGDTITFTFTGDALKSAPLLLTSTAAGAPATQSVLTLGRVDQTTTSVTYRVTEVGATPTGAVAADPHGSVTFAPKFDRTKVLAAGKVDVTAVSRLTGSNNVFDGATGTDRLTRNVLTIKDQTVAATTQVINATIDVTDATNPRKVFVGTPVQTVVFEAAPQTTLGNVAVSSHSFKVDGDFSWALANGSFVPGRVNGACNGGGTFGSLVVTASSASFVCSGVGVATTTGASLTLAPAAAGPTAPELAQTTYIATLNSTFVGDALQTTTGINAGAWGINGSVVHVPYMVYGKVGTKEFSQIINIANNSSATGKVFADVWTTAADGKVTRLVNNKVVGSVGPRGLYRAAGDIKREIEAAGFKDGYVQMRLTTDIGADNVTVYSAYVDNSNSERAIVNNDSPVNVRGFSQLATAAAVANVATTAHVTTTVNAARDAVNNNVNAFETSLCGTKTGTVDLSSVQNITVAGGTSTATTTGSNIAALNIAALCTATN